MNVKIGELVEYVEDLKRAHERKVKGLRDTIDDLVRIKEELEKECDRLSQVAEDLGKQVKVAEENAASCLKSFKEMEAQIDKSIKDTVANTKKEIRDRLKQFYGFSDTGLKDVGVL